MLSLLGQFCEALLLPSGAGVIVGGLLLLVTPHERPVRPKEPRP